jgi:hypothetical protein
VDSDQARRIREALDEARDEQEIIAEARDWHIPVPANVLREVGPLYHVTSAALYAAIKTEGLQPNKWDSGAYPSWCPPGVFLTPELFRNKYLTILGAGYGKLAGCPLVHLQIETNTAVCLNIAIDPTTTEFELFRQRVGDDPMALITCGVSLICYDVIPADKLIVVTS